MSETKIDFDFQPPFTYILVGNSGSGKTTLVKKLMKEYFKEMFGKNIFIMSPTMRYSGDFDEYKEVKEYVRDDEGHITQTKMVPNKNLFYEWDPTVIQEILDEQMYLINRYGKKRTPNVLILLDDVMEHLHNSKLIDQLFFKARHFNISTVCLFQKLKGLSRVARLNTKYLTVFRAGNESEIEDVLDEYTSKRQRSKMYDVLLEHFKEPWSFLHCDLKSQDFTHRYALGSDCKLERYVDLTASPSVPRKDGSLSEDVSKTVS